MRAALIILNVFLITVIAFGFFGRLGGGGEGKDTTVRAVKKKNKRGKADSSPLQKKTEQPDAVRNPEDLLAQIVEHNIFNPDRCPNARVAGRRNNDRIEMTLVGTFVIGTHSGAIILQKNSSLNAMQNARQLMAPGGAPGMSPPRPPMRINAAGGGSWQQRRFFPGMNPQGRFTQNHLGGDGNSSSSPEVVYQQYVRCGETLANGYTLLSVSRTGAVLTKGSDKLELTLVEASKAAASNAGNTNSTSVLPPGMFPNMIPEMMRMFQQRRNRMMNSQGTFYGNNRQRNFSDRNRIQRQAAPGRNR